MTQEEKAKAYDMALEQARKELKTCGSLDCDAARLIFRLFPPFAESEDERIRKKLVEYHKQQFEKNRDQEIGLFHKDALTYLERQKECIADSSKTSTSEDERIRRWLVDYFTEIGKNWIHREFTCKQIIAYLEKQKEQKPNIELIQRSWYREGYHDREFGKEPKWILKTGEGGPKHELNPRYGQPLTVQQVTEEQLHNLNEAIKGLRMDGCERMADSLHSLYNILKRNKEQKPAEWNANDKAFIKDCANILIANDYEASAERLLSMFPVKPAEWSEEDVKVYEYLKDGFEYATNNPQLLASRLWGGNDATIQDYKNFVDKLKSLRPQYHGDITMTEAYKMGLEAGKAFSWKPSKEEIDAFEKLLKGEFPNKIFPGTTLANLLNTLKKLYYNVAIPSTWKPSEEQMESLRRAVDKLAKIDVVTSVSLSIMYDNLKKLM